MSTVFFTIISRNYLAYAKTLMETVADAYPQAHRYVCLADEEAGDPDLLSPHFTLITCADLDLPARASFLFRYDIMELNTAIKPYVFQWLRHKHAGLNAVYLDPDLYLLRPLGHVTEALDAGASLVLTPHLNDPMGDDGKQPDELAIMRSGVYNCGFVAVGHTAAAAAAVDWWADKLEFGCYADPAAGLFTDQKWMDLAPGMFPDVSILRHDGYNVAYWNLAQRRLVHQDGDHCVNGQPLHFLHFSGVSLDKPDIFSKHQNRFRREDIGELAPLYDNYLACLERNGHRQHAKKPYAFGVFRDGVPISRWHRRVYKRFFDKGQPRFQQDPFSLDRAIFNEPTSELPHDERLPISLLMMEVWLAREDLRAVFDLHSLVGRDKYIRWYVASAERELGLTAEAVEPIHLALMGGEQSVLANIQSLNYSHSIAAPNLRLREILARAIGNTGVQIADWVKRNPRALALVDRIPARRRSMIMGRLRSLAATFMPASSGSVEDKAEEDGGSAVPMEVLRGGVNLIGYARGEFGVAENIRSYARALEAAGYPFVIRNFDIGVASRQADHSMDQHLSEDLPYAVNIFFVNADQMALVREHLPASAFEGRYNIGFWVWELEHFPEAWTPALDLVDEVWTPTEFVRGSIAQHTKKPVIVVPKSIDFNIPSGVSRRQFQLHEKEFVFLYSFDFNSFITRKNPEAAIQAFKLAFANVPSGVRLYVKCINGHRFPERLAALHEAIGGDERITVADGFLSRDEMFALQSVADVYLSLHRSEGFGLGMAEAMRLGKPVVATAYSGNTEFMRESNSCLVNYRVVALKEGEYPFWEGQVWADPDVEHAAQHLRRLYSDKSYRDEVSAAAQASILATNSKAKCATAVMDRLRVVEDLA